MAHIRNVGEARLCSCGDARLRAQDRTLLEPGEWLNDALIAFWFEYIASKLFPCQPGLLLIGGAEAFAIMNCGREAAPIFLEPLQYASRELVLLAVSNNPDVEAAGGGSHWSLLAHWRPADAFLHFDSMAGCNAVAARRLYDVLCTPSSRFEEMETPQQRNGYECGLVSLAIAQLLAGRYVEREQGMQFSLQRSEYDPDALRQLMCNVIDSCAAAEAAEQQVVGAAAGSRPT